MTFIPYGRQSIGEEEERMVLDALRSDFLTQGPLVASFEDAFARRVGAAHAVAFSNATAALHTAMVIAGMGPGHRSVTSPVTFVASANASALAGGIPDFCDVEEKIPTMDPALLADGWKADTRVVVAVDYAGQPADLPGIAAVAHKRGALVIEDACHGVCGYSHWGTLDGRPWGLGANPWADMGVFSFHPVKTLTTGEGGMLVTKSAAFAQAARRFRSHGIVRDLGAFEVAENDPVMGEKGPWYYEMQELGHNFRITDLQCALGLAQLGRLEGFLERRREIVARYNEAFSGLKLLSLPRLRDERDACTQSWHLYTVECDFTALGRTRSACMTQLREQGVGSQVLYIPVHLQPWYRRAHGFRPGMFPRAERFYSRCLSLPLYPSMSHNEVERVVEAVCEVFQTT